MSIRVSVIPGGGLTVERGQHQSVLPGVGVVADSAQLILLTQYRPSADVAAGNWSPSVGTTLYGVIDEVSADDADYIVSGANPTADYVEVKIAAQTPVANTNHTARYRIKSTGGLQIKVQWRCGASTLIKEWTHAAPPSTYTTYEQTLTAGEAATITNYSDLRLRFIAG